MPWSRGDIEDLQADYTRAQLVAFRQAISAHRMEPLDVVNQALTELNFGYQIKSAKEMSGTLEAIRGAIRLHDGLPLTAPNSTHLMRFNSREIE